MYAVIETGGRQYKVVPGEVIEVNRLPVEAGQLIDLDHVLMIGGDTETLVGQPTVPGAKVRAKVSGNPRSRKIIVFKYKSKVRYRRFNTHRQNLTRLVIKEILTGAEGEAASVTAVEDTEPTAPADVAENLPADSVEEPSEDVAEEEAPVAIEESASEGVAESAEEESERGA